MKDAINILLVEDNEVLQLALSELFEQVGHRVFFTDSADGIHEVLRNEIDVVLLDINLPGENGYSIATRLRASFPRLGIVMLTARGTHDDVIQGYRSGADNYFVKPFNSDLLLSAVENLGIRVRSMKEPIASVSLALNVSELLLVCPQDQLALTTAECALLHHFAMAPERRLETWQLMDVLGMDADDEQARHNLEVIVSRLRKKISKLCHIENPIKSIRGVGYHLTVSLVIL